MKKRILTTLLAVMLVISSVLLTSCKAFTIADIILATERTKKLDSFDAKMTITMDMEVLGMEVSMPVDMAIKVKDAKTENALMYAGMKMELLGQEIAFDTYGDKDWTYIVMGDVKAKQRVEEEDTDDYTETVEDMLVSIPEDLLKDVEIIENEDGSNSIDFELSGEKFKELFEETVEDMNDLSETETGSDISFSDINIKITVANGYIRFYEINYTMIDNDLQTEAKVKVKLEFVNPGEEVEIIFPEGYKDFPEMDI